MIYFCLHVLKLSPRRSPSLSLTLHLSLSVPDAFVASLDDLCRLVVVVVAAVAALSPWLSLRGK